jgi:hypothetical protein
MPRTLTTRSYGFALSFTAAVLWLAASQALAQTPVAPPPKPPDNGPSLEVTMKFIQDKLNGIGKVTYIVPYQNKHTGDTDTYTLTDEVSQVRTSSDQCTTIYHLRSTFDGVESRNGDFSISFKDAQGVVLKPVEQFLNEQIPSGIYSATDPPLVAMIVRTSHPELDKYFMLPFTDSTLADRVANAMVHAIELCGGGNKEPF